MTTIITALLYSGKQNPSWELTPEQSTNLKSILKEKKKITFEKTALSVGLLGYTGFVITSYDLLLPSKIYCFDGVIDLVDQKLLNFIDKDSKLEYFLLETGSRSLSKNEINFILNEISKNVKGGTASKNELLKKSFEPLTVPPLDLGKWNIPDVQPYNNCYNYANDKITNSFAQPGKGSGSTIQNMDCSDVSASAQRDGLISVSDSSGTLTEGHFIALVVAPYYDYHWYRLDSNAMWSHKPGATTARNTDNSGALISDPINCNRAPYTDFCGFFHCVPALTIIR